MESHDESPRLPVRGWVWWVNWTTDKLVFKWLQTTQWALANCLIEHEPPSVQAWATQKKSAVIKAGLNPSCSKIQPHYFNLLRNHTNSVEQSHQKSYASGKFLTLVEAVQKYLSTTYQLLRQTLLTILVLRNLIKMIFFNIKVFTSSMFTIHIELLQWRQIICVIWVGKVSYFKYFLSSWQVLNSII